ncbi:MAG: hypothetical protein GWM98_07360 [Nitrospinaceae bacterium]|nr:hypothetical protein [Nitrospinaceae bacterium]NIR54351.1 hypothetical protein [Nitrospinaceae bacterium]NIS84769.1 hypothetical protein [Nitrospinaceae bacterium]NIT81570.1 hypothetical protein [Nitrospinaceae bacterium]NIU43854.1 hypothetical protein [Nitrospinaceae bacterium]
MRIYPALVMRGTALHAMYQRGEYRPWDLEKTVRALKTAVQRLDQAGIPVIRMGLHAEPSLHEGYVDGPHHPALRSLVESSLCLDQMVRLLDRAGVLPERVIFKVPLRRVSNYTGHCKANIKALKSRYPGKSFVFQPTAELSTLELNLHN